MTDEKKTTKNRRNLLKSVAAGGGAIIAGKTLPGQWSRPVVDSVMLPAHATTSNGPFSGTLQASLEPDNIFAQAINSLIPEAQARPNYNLSWCVTPVSATTADVYFLLYFDVISPTWAELWSATGVPVNTVTPLNYSNGCTGFANADEWLNKLGLIRDAQAGPVPPTVKLSGVNPGDTFQFVDSNRGLDETRILAAGACGPTSVECSPPK